MALITINNQTNSNAQQTSSINAPPLAPLNLGTLVKILRNLTPSASPPSNPSEGDVYYDDGTNTSSEKPAFRRYDGSNWKDISSGGEDVNYYICADT